MMKTMLQLMLVFALQGAVLSDTFCQEPASRWEPQIRKFEEADAESPPQAGGIVFVGSSSIRMWDTDKWFPGQSVINRGFGGSQISDVNEFTERIVLKYKPSQIVFYAGDNDVAHGKDAKTVAEDFRKFGEQVAERLPKTHVIYVPIKPSLSRWKMWPKMDQANRAIQKYLDQRDNFHYADIVTPMLNDKGRPKADLFREDGLHLNETGYELWTGIVRPLLDR